VDLKAYELAPDMLLSSAVRATLTRGREAPQWKALFNPDEYAKQPRDMTVAGNQLTKEQLQQLGQRVTTARKLQRDRALAVNNDKEVIDPDAYLRSATTLASKMHMGYFRQPKVENVCYTPTLTKRERWSNLTLNDKIDIVHEVLVLKHPQHEVAKKYCRTDGYISSFLRKFRENRNLLREMMDQRDQALVKVEVVQEVIKELLDEDTFIENLQQVVD
jgi:hypothetical protein